MSLKELALPNFLLNYRILTILPHKTCALERLLDCNNSHTFSL
jgi:hypothetical protein